MKLLARLTIQGNPQTKANSRKIVAVPDNKGGARAAIAKSDSALAYVDMVHASVPADVRRNYKGPVLIIATLYYRSRRSDLTFDLVQDALQAAYRAGYGQRICVWKGVYENDRQVSALLMRKKLDAENPRVEISVYALPVANAKGDMDGPWSDLDHDAWTELLIDAVERAGSGVEIGQLPY